eukprot:scaffold68796_cov32-Tisochrysis_lutea.AAC.5
MEKMRRNMEKKRKNHETAGIDEKSVATTMRIDSIRAMSRSGRSARSTRSTLMKSRNCMAGTRAARIVIHETSTTMKSSMFQPDRRYALCLGTLEKRKPFAIILTIISMVKSTAKTTSMTRNTVLIGCVEG